MNDICGVHFLELKPPVGKTEPKLDIQLPPALVYRQCTPENWDYLLEGRALVVQASPAR